MGKGIPTSNFGSNSGASIRISFHNGTSVVNGYILSQYGDNEYKVAQIGSGGSPSYIVQLADTTAVATSLTALLATITVTPFGGGTEHVRNLLTNICYTTEGNTYSWQMGATSATGQAQIDRVP